jgi:hypothetical protein
MSARNRWCVDISNYEEFVRLAAEATGKRVRFEAKTVDDGSGGSAYTWSVVGDDAGADLTEFWAVFDKFRGQQ